MIESRKTTAETPIEREARHWVVVLSSDEATSDDRIQFETWRNVDPSHQAAFDEAERLWCGIEQLDHLKAFARMEDLERLAVDAPLPDKQTVRRFWRPAAFIGGTMAAALALAVFFAAPDDTAGPAQSNYVTSVAEIRDIALPDGSSVTLGARSRIDIHYTDEERRVVLLDGEAFFSVEKDMNRPFFVAADDTVIRVVGTKFEVRRAAERIRVSVTEGVVEVLADKPAQAPNGKTVLTAGQQMVAAKGALVEPVRDVTPSAPGAWRNGRLYYDDVTLAEVISDANRYYDGRIDLASVDIGDLRITGSFRTDRIDQMLANLEQILPVTVDRQGPGKVLLLPKAQAG